MTQRELIANRIIGISPSPGWRVVFALESKSFGVTLDVRPVGCFCVVKEICMKDGHEFDETRPLDEQDFYEDIETVEPYVRDGGSLLWAGDVGRVFLLLAPEEELGEADVREMERQYLERKRILLRGKKGVEDRKNDHAA